MSQLLNLSVRELPTAAAVRPALQYSTVLALCLIRRP
jgi:hypothetical protein